MIFTKKKNAPVGSEKITLREITEENLGDCEALKRKSCKYVGGPMWVVGQAYVHRRNTTAHGIYRGDTLVGLVLLIWDKAGKYSFTDMFIADGHQGRGYAGRAVARIVEKFAADGKFDTISIFVHDTNAAAIHVYEKNGFVRAGTASWSEHFLVMERGVPASPAGN